MITMDTFEKHYLDLVKFDRFPGMKLKVYAAGKITYTFEIIDNHHSTPDYC